MKTKYRNNQTVGKTAYCDTECGRTISDPNDIVTKIGQLQPIGIVRNDKVRDKVTSRGAVHHIYENDLSAALEHFFKLGAKQLRDGYYEDTLLTLKKADMVMTMVLQNDISVDWRQQMIIKLNLGICLYKVGSLEDALNCMENTLLFLKKMKQSMKDKYSLFNKKISIRCYLQCIILLSELGRHEEAVVYSKVAVKMSIQLIIKLHEYMSDQVEVEGSVDQQPKLMLLNEVIQRFDSLTAPILKAGGVRKIQSIYHGMRSSESIMDLQPIFRDLDEEWVGRSNILSFLQMKPLYMEDCFTHNQKESDGSSIIMVLGYLTVSYYCIATEGRFMAKAQSESENYLSHALEVAFLFLPHQMPIVGQIISVHSKLHGLSKQVILEGQDGQPITTPDEFDLILLRPYKGQLKGNFYIPLIRKCITYRNSTQDKHQKYFVKQYRDRIQTIEIRTTTSVQRKDAVGQQQIKLDQPWFFLDSIIRAKSATKKTQPQNVENRQQIQEIYSTKRRQFDKLPNKTVQIPYPASDGKRQPDSVKSQRVNQTLNMNQFFSSSNKSDKVQLERPKFNIQINNNFNILINDFQRKTPVKVKQLVQLNLSSVTEPKLFQEQINKSKFSRMFIARNRSSSDKQA